MDSAELQRIPDVNERHKLIRFMIDRFKRDVPGGMESVSRDSFMTIAAKIGLDYAHQTEPDSTSADEHGTYKWSDDVEDQLRVGFSQGYKAKSPEDAKEKCDCVIAKLKVMYPDSITVPLSDETMMQVTKSCFQ